MSMFLLGLSILPTVILGSYIYSNDKIEKEPVPLLVKLMASGVLAVILTLILTNILSSIAPFFDAENLENFNSISLAVYVFIGIALIEEFSKWFFTYLISWKDKAFNHVYDAIVYSVFVSLGFATIENILYVFGSENILSAVGTALVRMIFSVPGHAFFGVIMGYYLGLAKLTSINHIKDKSERYLFFSILLPTIGHFIFDYLLMSSSTLSLLLFLAFTIGLFIFSYLKVKRMSKIPTLLFNEPNKTDYLYNAFGGNNPPKKYCTNCGHLLVGPYCSNCGKKN